MKPVLVDTDILSEFFRGNIKVVSSAEKYLNEYETLNFSIITYYEIMNGLLYKDARNQLQKFLEFSKFNKIVPLTTRAATIAAETFADLRKRGKEIGHTDSLIAGIAKANDFVLATNNIEHFKRIKNLELVNWMK